MKEVQFFCPKNKPNRGHIFKNYHHWQIGQSKHKDKGTYIQQSGDRQNC